MRIPLLICLALISLNLAVYIQVRDFEFVNYDDGIHVYNNQQVKLGLSSEGVAGAFSSTLYGNYIPITVLSYLVDFQISGLNPRAYHLTNILFHMANSVLLFVVLWRLTSAIWPSAFAAALFAVHPLHVESIAWISARKDVLSTFFLLLVLLVYAAYARKPRPALYLTALALFALGLMGKSMLVTLPCLLLLLDYWPLNRFTQRARAESDTSSKRLNLLLEKVPFFVLTIIVCFITAVAQHAAEAVQSTERLGLGIRASNAVVAYAAYIGKTVWPAGLIPYYPHRGAAIPGASILAALGLLIAISALCFHLRRTRPYLIVGWLWFLGTLVPVIGLVQVGGQAMADRYTYMPLIGLFIMAAWGAKDCVTAWPALRRPLAVSGLAIVMGLSVVSWQQTRHWENSITLFEHTLRVSPQNKVALANLGEAYLSRGRTDKAIPLIKAVLAENPDNLGNLRNLATAYRIQGRFEEAEEQLALAMKRDPKSPKTFNLLGLVLLDQGKDLAAQRRFEKALELDPEFIPARISLGNVLLEQNLRREAVAHYRFVLERDPNHPDALTNLGAGLVHLKDYEGAIPLLKRSLEIVRDDAVTQLNLAVAYFELGRVDDARREARRALESDPSYSKAEAFLQYLQSQPQ